MQIHDGSVHLCADRDIGVLKKNPHVGLKKRYIEKATEMVAFSLI